MKTPSEEIFDFYSSLSEEQQESLEVKWSEDPSSAVDEAITLSKASGYSFDRDFLEATVKALLNEDSEADVELSQEVMAAVAGGWYKRSTGARRVRRRKRNSKPWFQGKRGRSRRR